MDISRSFVSNRHRTVKEEAEQTKILRKKFSMDEMKKYASWKNVETEKEREREEGGMTMESISGFYTLLNRVSLSHRFVMISIM